MEQGAGPGSDTVDTGDATTRTPTALLAARLQSIVEVAERSAEQVRVETEQRALDRIAEADRAAAYRVQAAEEEAAEILADAHARAQQAATDAVNAVDSIHAEAHAALREAKARLAQAHLDAEKQAKQTVDRAREEAREIVRNAHLATRDVMEDGSVLSDELRELSASLRTNAERLLRDIRLAHGSMTARLDQALPDRPLTARGGDGPRDAQRPAERDGEAGPSARRRSRSGQSVDFEVPDFVVPEE